MKKLLIIALIVGIGTVFAADYVGSSACSGCHGAAMMGQSDDFQYNIYEAWSESGHPFKANIKSKGWNILGAGADGGPQYPHFVQNFQENWMTNLETTWEDDISGVIGGFGWKARFIDNTGKIVGTLNSEVNPGAGQNQYNFFEGEEWGWGDYHPSDDKTYNYGCFRCHTTGASEEGTWLEGVDELGSFAEDGVGCESCHGPGGDHVGEPSSSNIDLVYEYDINYGNGLAISDTDTLYADAGEDRVNFLCGTCHNRGFNAQIEASDGYIKHHEPWEEMLTTDHYKEGGMDCATCHDPHKRVIWDGDAITKTCESCHTNHVTNHSDAATCVDCHMPYAGKSAVARGESGYKGDIRSHLFDITVDAESMFTEDGSSVQDDENREASLDLGFACLGCHNDDPNDAISDKTLEEAAEFAAEMHEVATGTEGNIVMPKTYFLAQNYPNPFNPETMIAYGIAETDYVNLEVYDMLGKKIATLINEKQEAGDYSVQFDGTGLSTGLYFYKLETASFSQVNKMVLLR